MQRQRQRIVGAFVGFLGLILSVTTASAVRWTEIGGAEFARAVPEPSSLIFFGVGLIGFAVASRKLTRRR